MRKPLIPQGWNQNNAPQEKSNAVTTLTSSPNEIVLSENIANFTFNPVETGLIPYNSYGFIQIIDYIDEGDTITITSDYTSITLTASTTPGSNEFYTESVAPVGAALLTYLETVTESIANTLLESLSLKNNYTVEYFALNISITANLFGDKYNFINFSTTSPNISMSTQTGVNRYESSNYISYTSFANIYIGEELYGDVMNKSNSTFISSKIIDSANSVSNLNASSISDYVTHILPYKAPTTFDGFYMMDQGFTSNGVIFTNEDIYGNHIQILRPYFLEYGDRFAYSENQVKKSYTKGVSEVRWVQLGAYDKLLPYNMQDYVWNPINPNSFKWLTSCPNNKTVTNTSHEFLQTILKRNYSNRNFNLQLVCNFYDGTSKVIDKTSYGYQALGGNVSFDVCPRALDLQAIELSELKNIDTYSIRLVWDVNGSVNGLSEFKTYKYDRKCYTNTYNIIFVNEFGAWDSIEFRGSIQQALDRTINTIERGIPFNANTTNSVNAEVDINISTDVDSVFTMNSGLMESNILEWSKKLAESSAVYIWDEIQNQYRSIIVDSTDFVNSSVDTGRNLLITFSYGSSNNTIKR